MNENRLVIKNIHGKSFVKNVLRIYVLDSELKWKLSKEGLIDWKQLIRNGRVKID